MSNPFEEIKKDIQDIKESLLLEIASLKADRVKEDEWLTRDEAALFLKRSVETIDLWAKKGTITKYGISGSILFKKSELNSIPKPLRAA